MYLWPSWKGDRAWKWIKLLSLSLHLQLLGHAEFPVVSVIAKLSPDTAVETSPIPMQATASTGASKPRLYYQKISTIHCALCRRRHIMPARYEYNSYIASIVLVFDTLSRPCNLGLVRSLTE
jgi:hypothetical protein